MNNPLTTTLRRQVILQNYFLVKIYSEWYKIINNEMPDIPGEILELGSGGGFMDKFMPETIKSEIIHLKETHLTLDGQNLPFPNQSLKAITMTNVLHHIPDNRLFFSEARRCIKPGGSILMIEPWNTFWSHFVYNVLHHEPFNPSDQNLVLTDSGPMTSANDALPWIIFKRDKQIFTEEFPELQLINIHLMMPFRYLVSGGVSLKQLMPDWSYSLWKGLETILSPFNQLLSMFAFIHLKRQ